MDSPDNSVNDIAKRIDEAIAEYDYKIDSSFEIPNNIPENDKTKEDEFRKMSDELKERARELEHSINNNINNDVNETHTEDEIDLCNKYLFYAMYLPRKLSMIELITAMTNMKYDPYDSPDMLLLHTIPEIIVYVNRFNKLFETNIRIEENGQLNFKNIDNDLSNFVSKNCVQCSQLSSIILTSTFIKFIMCLYTTTDLAFHENKYMVVDKLYQRAILKDVVNLRNMNKDKLDNHISIIDSWVHFIKCFTNTDTIMNEQPISEINELLSKTFNANTPEISASHLANILKGYFPSISIGYFYAIKSVFLILSLIDIYISKQKQRVLLENVKQDIETITSLCVIAYEQYTHTFKGMERVMPNLDANGQNMNEQTRMYIMNHILKGGQYMILKFLEKSINIILPEMLTSQINYKCVKILNA